MPEYLRDIYEIHHLLRALSLGFAQMTSYLNALLNGAIHYFPNAVSAQHWGKVFGEEKLDSVELNRKVLARFAMKETVNFEFITNYLDKMCITHGHVTTFDCDSMVLTVQINESYLKTKEITKYLREVLPCNIALKVIKL